MPRDTQYLASVAVLASSKNDIYRRVAIGIAQLLGTVYVVAISKRETLSRDSPKHLGWNFLGYWVCFLQYRRMYERAKQATNSFAKFAPFFPFLHLCLKKLG